MSKTGTSADVVREIRVYSPDNESHGAIDEQPAAGTRNAETTMFYNQIIEAYNKMDVDGIMIFPAPEKSQTGNIARVLKGRGLEKDADFEISKIALDEKGNPYPVEERPMRLKRLTDVVGRILEVK